VVAKKILKVLVHPSVDIESAELSGHDVEVMERDIAEYDLILGPNCWRVTTFLTKFIKNAVTAAKNTKVRRPRK
jgi:hypothetical protein